MQVQRDPFLWKCIEFHAKNLKAFKLKKLWEYVELKHSNDSPEKFRELKKELLILMGEKISNKSSKFMRFKRTIN